MKTGIKFRAQDKITSEWLYGYYGYDKQTDSHFIFTDDVEIGYEVKPETIGQLTNITDKNGKEIYGGQQVRKYFGWKANGEIEDFVDGVVKFGKFLVNKDDWGIEHFVYGWHFDFSDGSGSIAISEEMEVVE